MSDLVKRITSDTHPNIFVDIVYDPDPEEPDTFPVYITYNASSRYKLGNQQLNNHEHSEVARKIPVRRLGRPEDVAKAVAFLASDESGFITGETLDLSSGLYKY